MNTLQKRVLAAACAVAVLGVAGYWYWSPYLVMRQMRNAAANVDADSFNDHVDYPKLRESLKGQLSARIAGELESQSNPGSAFGTMLGLALVDKLVDAVVRPEMIMRAMEDGNFQLQGRQRDAGIGNIRRTAAQTDINTLSQAVKLYKLDHGVYPSTQQGLQVLADPAARPDGNGSYIERLPKDPWGHPYNYASPGKDGVGFEISYSPPPGEEGVPKTRELTWRIERKGINKILVHADTKDGASAKAGPLLVMRREGFADWKLTEIRLPE